MMRFWFDTEFTEDGKTIDLLSIGVVAEDGREYYAEPAEADLNKASPWVIENVLPHMTGEKKPRSQIAAELIAFAGEKPEFWAYYADYDWVALCQLFGRMIDLPKGWPMYCRDLKQWADAAGKFRLPKQESHEHHALADARWNKASWELLESLRTPDAHRAGEEWRPTQVEGPESRCLGFSGGRWHVVEWDADDRGKTAPRPFWRSETLGSARITRDRANQPIAFLPLPPAPKAE